MFGPSRSLQRLYNPSESSINGFRQTGRGRLEMDHPDDMNIPTGDDQYESGETASGYGGNEAAGKGTAGHDSQNRRDKGAGDDEPQKKGTAGTDGGNRRDK